MSFEPRPATVVADTADQIYYRRQYWNELPEVVEHLSECLTGDRQRWWVADFQDRFCQQPFRRGLFLNCGNGWVEREFIDRAMVKEAVAFDYSHELLAQSEKDRGSRPIRYFQADCNLVNLDRCSYDLVVNVAALHHVQYIDRLCRQVRQAMADDGVFVNYDYVGPSRNQYAFGHWQHVRAANRHLPADLRKPDLKYPRLAAMLATDPTEAIHSSLILSTVARYFDILERHDAGGGIAYEVLNENPNLADVPQARRSAEVGRLLTRDRELTRSGRIPSLFSYFIGRPRSGVLDQGKLLAGWEAEEEARERRAARRGGVYSTRQYVEVSLRRRLGRVRRRLLRRS